MIEKMKRYITLAAAALLAFASCDVFEKAPLDKLSPESYFKTELDLQLFSNTFYNNLLNKEPYKWQSDHYVTNKLSTLVRGGDSRVVPDDGGGWDWGDNRKINTLLGNIHNCEDQAAVEKYTGVARFFRAFDYYEKVKRFGDVPWIDKELGSADPELYAPRDSRELIMTKMLEDIDYAIEYLPAARSTYRVNKWSALALKAQFCLFEGTYRKYHNLNLEGHDWKFYLEQAADAAKQIIDGGVYSLYTTGHPDKDYMMLFAQDNASPEEYILAVKYDYGLNIKHNATAYAVLASQGRPGATKKFVDSYLMKDGSRFTDQPAWAEKGFAEQMVNRDPRLGQTVRTPGYTRIGQKTKLTTDLGATVTGYQLVKFVMDPSANGSSVDRPDYSTNDMPVYRYAEVLLNYAEAKAELGTLTQADLEISINQLRKRAGMPDLDMVQANDHPDWYLSSDEYGYSHVTGENQGVILEIRRERAVELAQEGDFRWFDLMRWNEGKCVEQQLYGIYFPGPGEYDLDADGVNDCCLYESAKPETSAKFVYQIGKEIILSEGNKGYIDPYPNTLHVFDENRDYLYPIPSGERTLNHNLTQNPGWNDGLDF